MPCNVMKGTPYETCVLDENKSYACRWTHTITPTKQRITDKRYCQFWSEPVAFVPSMSHNFTISGVPWHWEHRGEKVVVKPVNSECIVFSFDNLYDASMFVTYLEKSEVESNTND